MFSRTKVLCAKELFKYRRQQDRSVPQKGGPKDYAPDGSWLEAKHLESFLQERTAVLGEPRVERLGSLVQAEWNPEKCLVEFQKEVGKFWSHMGFVDESRKWLYPEEALFLQETNVLEIYFKSVPLSIQEAYTRLLGSDISVEEYQTYAHLQRLGYVVLRHTGGSGITRYEKKIKLDQHLKKSRRRPQTGSDSNSEQDSKLDVEIKRQKLDDTQNVSATDASSQDMETEHVSAVEGTRNKTKSFSTIVWGISGADVNSERGPSSRCEWDFSAINFPDIGGGRDSVILHIPEAKYLPPNVMLTEEFEDICLFDVLEYRQQQLHNKGHNPKWREESDNFVHDLDFSYADWSRNRKKVSASNWTEYKRKLKQTNPQDIPESPAAHLWEEEVTPLVHPEDAKSTSEVLQRIQVIESVEFPLPDRKPVLSKFKISYDVYLPNAKFRKTSPGVPNHRVCVVRSSEPPPSLADVAQAVRCYGDDVPVNWAVVDSGDIAFYNMSSMSIPVDITMG